jgi:hypothetical protein
MHQSLTEPQSLSIFLSPDFGLSPTPFAFPQFDARGPKSGLRTLLGWFFLRLALSPRQTIPINAPQSALHPSSFN